MTLAQYLEHCDETGAYPLPETHYVWVRAEKMGLPDELVLLDWHAFKDKYLNDQNAKNKSTRTESNTFAIHCKRTGTVCTSKKPMEVLF